MIYDRNMERIVNSESEEYFNIRPLKEYLEKNDSEYLEHIMRMVDEQEEAGADIGEEDDEI